MPPGIKKERDLHEESHSEFLKILLLFHILQYRPLTIFASRIVCLK